MKADSEKSMAKLNHNKIMFLESENRLKCKQDELNSIKATISEIINE